MNSDEQRVLASILFGVVAVFSGIYLGYLNLFTLQRYALKKSFRIGIALISISMVLAIILVSVLTWYIDPDRTAVPIIEHVGCILAIGIAVSSALAVFCFCNGLLRWISP